MKKTIVVINDFDYIQGGATKVALDTAQSLYENDVNVIYFSAVHKENEYKFKQITTNQKECLKDGIKGALRGLYNVRVAKKLKKLLNTLDRENTIIHIHGWTKALSSSIFRILGKQNFKVVLTIHDYFTACPNGGFFNYKKCEACSKKAMSFDCLKTNCDSRNFMFKIYRVIRQYIQNINIKKCKNLNLINISDFSLDKLIKYYSKDISINKVYNPITVDKQPRAKIENNNYYVFVGRVSKEKGVDIFCEAVSEANVKAVVVGDGDQKNLLQEKYKNIEFVGWKNSKEVNEYMREAKALIFPSKWYEGAPLTTLEALAIGLPCIVSNKCAAIDFINENNGLIYDGTVNDLVKKILDYEKIDLKKISENLYQDYWKNPFDTNRYYTNLIKVYERMLKEKK